MEKINGIENISKKAIELTVKEVCKKYFNFDFDSFNGKKKIAKKIVAKKVANKIEKPADKIEKPIEDNEIKIDPIIHLIAPKNEKIKVNQTALWRTLIYYVDTKKMMQKLSSYIKTLKKILLKDTNV